MNERMNRMIATITTICLMTLGLTLAGCGGGGGGGTPVGISSQVVSGVASVGAPLAGQVSLKDASTPPQEKSTVIGSDGSFAIDVTGMKAPFVLQAKGNGGGSDHTLNSFADGPGTANINPLAHAVVASAAGVDDPGQVYSHPDPATLQKIKANLPATISAYLAKLQPLLHKYNADNEDPMRGHVAADHSGLDGLFDNVNITIVNGAITITNAQTGAVIFTGKLSDIQDGKMTDDVGSIPGPPARPAAPAGVTATGAANQVSVTWPAVTGATSYNLYWSTTSGVTTANGTKVANATSPYVMTGLPVGTTYYCVVTAVNGAGEGTASAQASAATTGTPAPAPTAPAAPSNVIATGGTNQVTLSWPAVTGATSYNLYWSTTSGVTTGNGTKIAGAISPAVHASLTASTTYYYIVTAVSSAGESAASAQVAATTLTPAPTPTSPGAPIGVTATGGANQVTLSWPAVTGATSYNVYWSTTSGVTPASGTKIAGATSPYVQTGCNAGTAYYYIVTAVNAVGESAASTQATATTNAPLPVPPAAPTGVAATGGTKQMTLSWSMVPGATSYNIYWSTATGVTTASGAKIAGATSPYVQSGLADGTAYFYIVTAVNGAGEGTASAQASATTTAALPPPPPAIDGAALYNQYCQGCHGPLASSDKKGTTVSLINNGIATIGGMKKFATTGTAPLSADQIAAIAAALK